jgi:hypothetical protein
MARTIPSQITELEPHTFVHLLEQAESVPRSFKFFPRWILNEDGSKTFSYGSVRRRRGVADIHIPGFEPVEIVKQSAGMLIMAETDDETRRVLETLLEHEHSHDGFETNSEVARAAGKAFERAIKAPKGETTDIIPISAHYMMIVRKPIKPILPDNQFSEHQDYFL